MTQKENFVCTLVLVAITCLFAVVIPNIGDAMTIVGATTNPIVGFTLPIYFNLKMQDMINQQNGTPTKCSLKRVFGHLVNIIVLLAGASSLYMFILRKTNPSSPLLN